MENIIKGNPLLNQENMMVTEFKVKRRSAILVGNHHGHTYSIGDIGLSDPIFVLQTRVNECGRGGGNGGVIKNYLKDRKKPTTI